MIKLNIDQGVNRDGVVFHKNRKIHKSDIEFVLTILECNLGQPHCRSANALSLGDIAGAGLWLDAMEPEERRQTGLCFSWLVDHDQVPLVKLPYKRGNTLLYRLNSTH